jgi:hypothetical protein
MPVAFSPGYRGGFVVSISRHSFSKIEFAELVKLLRPDLVTVAIKVHKAAQQ